MVRVTVPVGVTPVPATVPVTPRVALEFNVVEAGITVMVGVGRTRLVTVTWAVAWAEA